jgi:hypothetical protein
MSKQKFKKPRKEQRKQATSAMHINSKISNKAKRLLKEMQANG